MRSSYLLILLPLFAVQAAAQEPAAPPLRPSLAPLVEHVSSAVVGVTTQRTTSNGSMDELLRRFFGGQVPNEGQPHPQTGIGSGVIIDSKGLVLTNSHVVAGAEQVRVKTFDQKEYPARVKGIDPATDVAVLELSGVQNQLPAAKLGTSELLRVGDTVVAIGSPFGLDLTVTEGIVSAKARIIGAGPYDDFLQTDAAINPGNSGGPLFDMEGRVVGINTAIVSSGQGIGFAVPIDVVKQLLPQLLSKGRVVRGFLGLTVQDLTPSLAQALGLSQGGGAVIAAVSPDGPGAKADVKPGDAVVHLDGEPVESAAALTRKIAALPPGRQVKLDLMREGHSRSETLTLAERPAPEVAQARPLERHQENALGLYLQPVPPEMGNELSVKDGALIAEIEPGSRAATAGLTPGEVIVEAGRKPVHSPHDLISIARQNGAHSLLVRSIGSEGPRYVVIPADGH